MVASTVSRTLRLASSTRHIKATLRMVIKEGQKSRVSSLTSISQRNTKHLIRLTHRHTVVRKSMLSSLTSSQVHRMLLTVNRVQITTDNQHTHRTQLRLIVASWVHWLVVQLAHMAATRWATV